MSTRLHSRWACLSLLLLVVTAGCGKAPSDAPATGHVTGTVKLDDKPLANVIVSFQPEVGRGSTGKTDAEGRYTLAYSEGVEGAIIGSHRVSIVTPTEAPDPTGAFKDPIPARYNTKSELVKQVAAGENTIDFDLQSK